MSDFPQCGCRMIAHYAKWALLLAAALTLPALLVATAWATR